MNYLTFKLVISEDPGAKIFQKLAEYWNSTSRLDENYFGPEFYWAFFQLGDFPMEEMAIIKWEVWSQYRLRGNFEDLNKSAYIGVTCGLFIYYPQNPDSYIKLKDSINLFFEKRRSDIAPFTVLAIVEKDEREIPDEHKNFIEANGGNINILTESFLEKNIQQIIIFTFINFLKELRPEFCTSLTIEKNFWSLTLSELRAILMADRQGIQLKSRHIAPSDEYLIEKTFEEEEKDEEPTEDELKFVAISPKGEVVPISKEITPSEVLELIKKGYKLPAWVVIPRHCSNCFNQNQNNIREIEDKTVILMEYPRIYGMKFICGNCGHSWRGK
ncbi:hypothetical protein DSAG12_00421 [Promethearchaeum syntrophicum]|uniref:Uncharacterized protein n=1 Tax=Promethearchaeum syntrophicum TaxID=2594042 RepID=A0A5B9D643_9ARCH|nr:hypothetical protein [Candidatus Prometheoarchaeum syntrophicum]QEE14608.1 hypothetical protein DSAG12_00421 [Candidatus Prometheoarchaeum syntrophicum]